MKGGQGNGGLTEAGARKLEYAIIGLGVLALLMIFQPFNISLFAIGAIVVVLAALANNLLPLAQPGVPRRSVVKVAMVIAMIFCIVLLLAIFAAHLYGVFFLKPPDPNTLAGKAQLNATPWYMHGFTWTIAVIAAVLAGLIAVQNRRRVGD
jgi:multisubunit Na+/H+ antiporter MnhB subunit